MDIRLSDHAEDDGGDERAADAAHAAQHGDGEHPADVVAIGRRDHRRDADQQRAGQAGGRDADAERDGLDLDGIGAHQAQRQAVLGHRHDGPPVERPAEEEVERQRHGEADDAGHQIAEGDADAAEARSTCSMYGVCTSR